MRKSIPQQMHDAMTKGTLNVDGVYIDPKPLTEDQIGEPPSEKETPSVKTDAQHIAELKTAIEELSDGPVMWSRSALTARGTRHAVFVNGYKPDQIHDVERVIAQTHDLVRLTFEAVRDHRAEIAGDVNLVWRCEPEIQREQDYVRVRVRLCFEPSLRKVANGVWVESNLADTHW